MMTLYLTDDTPRDEVDRVTETDEVYAFKYYPAGATTHSASGVTDIKKVMPLLEYMAQRDVPLLVHGEVTNADVDVYDREKVFIERALAPLAEDIGSLRIVFEHVTTRDAVQFVTGASARVAATITPHHLMLNRNAMLSGGINPHHYCLPILKRESAPPGPGESSRQRQSKIFPRYRQRASSRTLEGKSRPAARASTMLMQPLSLYASDI